MKLRKKRKVLIVTGLSGAGHSTALRALEDLGYTAIDNLPLSLIEPLLKQKQGRHDAVAIGIDSRIWDFSAAGLQKCCEKLAKRKDIAAELVFLDCQDELLHKRFTETRRRHPLAFDRPVREGILQERRMMRPVRAFADHVIDTSDIKPQDLRHMLEGYFQLKEDRGIFISVTSFGFKNGLPREADLVFDVRFLDNPYWSPKLRPLSGQDQPVIEMVRQDQSYKPFVDSVKAMLKPLLPRYDREGKNYLTIAVGCTGGRHRSVVVAEELTAWLHSHDYSAGLRHRDMDSWGLLHGVKPAALEKNPAAKKKRH